MNGFDMLEQFDRIPFDVVFCTAYDQFAIRAFKYAALNYLLKPVDPDDLKETIRRVEERSGVPTKGQIDLLNRDRLVELSAFDPSYLHLD